MASNIQFFIFRATLLILFVVSLFFVLFLANGYKYDFISNQIRRTGIVDVVFDDKKAQVFLDGKKLDGNLPFVASNVLPGKYNLVVAREGFWDWNRQIVVTEDIISKIDDVLLYPLDEHSVSKVLIDTTDLKSTYWLRGDYFFEIKGKSLAFGKLNESLTETDLIKVVLPSPTMTLPSMTSPANDLQEIDVQINKAVLSFGGGKRYLLDLISGELSPLNANKNLVYAFDKWIYFKDNLLAVFDLNLKKVIFAKEFNDESIAEVRNLTLDGKTYLLVKMKGLSSGTLYQYINQNLLEVAERVVSTPLLDEKGNLIVLNEYGELWRYDLLSEKKLLLARFSGKVDLVGFALNAEKTAGQMLWKEGQNWNIGDVGLSNVRSMFKKNQIIDIKLVDNGKIFYLEKIQTDAPENAIQIRLMEMALDI